MRYKVVEKSQCGETEEQMSQDRILTCVVRINGRGIESQTTQLPFFIDRKVELYFLLEFG